MTATRIAPSNRLLYALIAALLVVSVAVQLVRDRGWQPYEPPSGVMWIRSGPLASRLALGFDNLVADVYWIRAVVYFGGQRQDQRQPNFDQLYPLLDLVTSLDPYFRIAYRFGSIFLAEKFPGGAGRPDLSIELLRKGLESDPGRWEYAQDIGFVYYWWLSDYAKAAEWFKRAGELPNAPNWLPPLAAVTLAEGGNRDSSRKLWTELRDNADVDWIRTNAGHRLKQLDAMDAIDELNIVTQRFTERTGRPPANWVEVARMAGWRGTPVDPGGTSFALDPVTGRVSLAENSTLWPLPVGPAANIRP
jgi:tetratricopeptide (TPR) repeat protein